MAAKNLTLYRQSRKTISRFVFKRSVKSAVVWALILGTYVASKSIGFAKLYSTPAQRLKFASSFGGNSSLSILLGKPHDITTVAGYTAWNCLGIAVIALSIWSIVTTAKYLRGDEVSGRLEVLLTGQTSLKKATGSIMSALVTSLLVLFIVAGLFFSAVGADKIVGFSSGAAFYLSLSMSLGGLMFIALTSLTSQLVPTRARAIGISAGLFGLFFLIKAVGDSTNLTWAANISPLGWIDNLRPLTTPKPIWLVPVLLLSGICFMLTLFISGNRDLGSSLIKDKQETKPRLRLLYNPLGLTIRLSRMSTLAWILGIMVSSLFYGLITNSAVKALADSSSTKKAFKGIVSAGAVNSSAAIYVSLTFLITMVIMFFFSAYLINHIRNEEAVGQLDNFLVGPVGRVRWLSSKLAYATIAISITSLLGALAVWVGTRNVHSNSLSLHNLILAGLNSIPATLLVFGIGVFIFGFLPRLTAAVVYAVIGWSFLVDMLESGTKINHLILDTSIFTHVHLAPAAKIDWGINLIILGLAVALALIGLYRFNTRDITSE